MIGFGRMVILVKGYEEALGFYAGKLGLDVEVDIDAGERRFVHLTFPGQESAGFWLLKAETERDLATVGRQAGDQPFGVIYTDDFDAEYERLQEAGIEFLERPVNGEGQFPFTFSDLYGNQLVLVQVTKA